MKGFLEVLVGASLVGFWGTAHLWAQEEKPQGQPPQQEQDDSKKAEGEKKQEAQQKIEHDIAIDNFFKELKGLQEQDLKDADYRDKVLEKTSKFLELSENDKNKLIELVKKYSDTLQKFYGMYFKFRDAQDALADKYKDKIQDKDFAQSDAGKEYQEKQQEITKQYQEEIGKMQGESQSLKEGMDSAREILKNNQKHPDIANRFAEWHTYVVQGPEAKKRAQEWQKKVQERWKRQQEQLKKAQSEEPPQKQQQQNKDK